MSIINKEKIVFVTIDWMKYYEGITEKDEPLGTGGGYPKEEKHEIYNFQKENGKCYGLTPPYGKLNLKRICPNDIHLCSDGYSYIDNVLVVFAGSNRDGRKRRIIGFYLDAKVFNKPYESKSQKRIVKSTNTYATYNTIVKAENAYLLKESDRNFELPYARKDGFGCGMYNVWYASENDKRVKIFRNKVALEIQRYSHCQILK